LLSYASFSLVDSVHMQLMLGMGRSEYPGATCGTTSVYTKQLLVSLIRLTFASLLRSGLEREGGNSGLTTRSSIGM
jgi:hypothetical protein